MTQPDNKWVVLSVILEYADADHIDTKALAEKHQITTQAVGARLKNLKTGPNIYKELLKAGYDEPVIPGRVHRPGSVDQSDTSVDRSGAERTGLDQAETPVTSPLGEGVTETQLGGAEVQPSAFRSRMLPDSELSRLGIVKGGDGRYYKASDGLGGSIVLRPVDPNIAVAASKTGLDVASAICEAATEEYYLNVMAITRKVAQG